MKKKDDSSKKGNQLGRRGFLGFLASIPILGTAKCSLTAPAPIPLIRNCPNCGTVLRVAIYNDEHGVVECPECPSGLRTVEHGTATNILSRFGGDVSDFRPKRK